MSRSSDKEKLIEIFHKHRVDILAECNKEHHCDACNYKGVKNCRLMNFADILLDSGFAFKPNIKYIISTSKDSAVEKNVEMSATIRAILDNISVPIYDEGGSITGVTNIPLELKEEIILRLSLAFVKFDEEFKNNIMTFLTKDGEWRFDGIGWTCSNCGEYYPKKFDLTHKPESYYCPNCFARIINCDNEVDTNLIREKIKLAEQEGCE